MTSSINRNMALINPSSTFNEKQPGNALSEKINPDDNKNEINGCKNNSLYLQNRVVKNISSLLTRITFLKQQKSPSLQDVKLLEEHIMLACIESRALENYPVIAQTINRLSDAIVELRVLSKNMYVQTSNIAFNFSAPLNSTSSLTANTDNIASNDAIKGGGEDKMTSEEKIWHQLSQLMLYWDSGKELIPRLKKFFIVDNKLSEQESLKLKANILQDLDKLANSLKISHVLKVQDGANVKKINRLLDFFSISHSINKNGDIEVNVSEYNDKLSKHLKGMIKNNLDNADDLKGLIVLFKEDEMRWLKNDLAKLNDHYPHASKAQKDDRSLSGLINSISPAFNSVDSVQGNVYRSLLQQMVNWQDKINNFGTLLAQMLNTKTQWDGTNFFTTESYNLMAGAFDSLEKLENCILALGGNKLDDYKKILEGTGIKIERKVGTLLELSFFKETVLKIKRAIAATFSYHTNKNHQRGTYHLYSTSPESLAQFQKTLELIQAGIDTAIKKSSAQGERLDGIYRYLQQMLSKMIEILKDMIISLLTLIK